jgi:hypothetical protein
VKIALLSISVWAVFGFIAYIVLPHNRVGTIELYMVFALIALVYWILR